MMIIRNNFNNKNANPLDDYKSIGKTRDNTFLDDENNNIKDNLNNEIIKDIIRKDNEFDDDSDESNDKWDFFR